MRYKKGGAEPMDVTDTIDETSIGVFDNDLDLSSINANGITTSDLVMSDISAIEGDDSVNDSEINDISFDSDNTMDDDKNETTVEDISYGGRRTRKIRNKRNKRGKRKTRQTRKKRITTRRKTKQHRRRGRKTRGRKTRGGSNVGCNTSDPNFSIYNTQMLKLFPYKA